jgi:hypothetical protein
MFKIVFFLVVEDIQDLIDSSEFDLVQQLEDSKVAQPELHDTYKRNYNEQLVSLLI